MAQRALPPGAIRRRAVFGLLDADGWTWAGLRAGFWFLFIIFLPFLGTLIYLIFRPAGATKDERERLDQANKEFVQKYTPSDTSRDLKVLSDLHDRGKLSDEEFAQEKARILK